MLKKENVSETLQNSQVENQEVENKEVEEVKVPKFLSPFIIKRSETRTINTGNYENTRIEAGIEVKVEIGNQEEYNQAVEYLTVWLKEDLDKQEELVKGKVAEKEAKVEEEKIQKAKEMEEEMKNTNIYVWDIQTNVGTLNVSNDPHYQMRCPRCGRPLVKRSGRFGEFYGCQGYGDETNKCSFGVNKSLLDEFFGAVKEVIDNKAPHIEKLSATIQKNGNDKYITINKDVCYQNQQENQGEQIYDESDLPF